MWSWAARRRGRGSLPFLANPDPAGCPAAAGTFPRRPGAPCRPDLGGCLAAAQASATSPPPRGCSSLCLPGEGSGSPCSHPGRWVVPISRGRTGVSPPRLGEAQVAAGGRGWRRLSGAASTRAVSAPAPWQLKRGAAAVLWPRLKWVCGFFLSR